MDERPGAEEDNRSTADSSPSSTCVFAHVVAQVGQETGRYMKNTRDAREQEDYYFQRQSAADPPKTSSSKDLGMLLEFGIVQLDRGGRSRESGGGLLGLSRPGISNKNGQLAKDGELTQRD